MRCEIIQGVAYDTHDDFQHVNFTFSQNFISLFWGLFNDETALRGKVGCCNSQWTKYKNCDPFKYYLLVNQVSNSSYWL